MKKIISAILAVLFIISASAAVIPAVSAADEGLRFELTNASGVQDGEFTIDLVVKNNPGIYAFIFMLYYNSDTFILRDFKVNEAFSDVFAVEDTKNNDKILEATNKLVTPAQRFAAQCASYGIDPDENYSKIIMFESKELTDVTVEGVAATLTFQIQGIAKDGTYEIGLIPDAESIINYSAIEEVPFTWVNSMVAVGNGSQTPADTAPVKKPETVVAPGDQTTKAPETTEAPVDTYVGDDGKIYYENEQGETEEYDPDDFKSPEELIYDNETTAADIEGEKSEKLKTKEKESKTALIIIISTIAVLIAVACVFLIFVFKSEKEIKENNIENNIENNKENNQEK